MKGYRTAIHENSVPLGEFEVGSGVIILTLKGEPIMSGPVGEVREPQDQYEDDSGALKVGNRWFSANSYSFRHA
jgi:hypothetical protein